MSKRKKVSGESYLSTTGTAMPGRQLKTACAPCRLNCSVKIGDELRQQLFDTYYAFGDLNSQRGYLGRLIDKSRPKERIRRRKQKPGEVVKERKERLPNIFYFLPINGVNVRVCGLMFRNTFDISKSNVNTIMRKTNKDGILVEGDLRGGARNRRSQ